MTNTSMTLKTLRYSFQKQCAPATGVQAFVNSSCGVCNKNHIHVVLHIAVVHHKGTRTTYSSLGVDYTATIYIVVRGKATTLM